MGASQLITEVAQEVQQALDARYAAGEPAAGSALDQAGLRDGADVVADYLSHGEAGVAFEHLIYMIIEPDLDLSASAYRTLTRAGELLGMPKDIWSAVRKPAGG